MKRKPTQKVKAIETATLFEVNEIASNVLDFSSTLRELRKTVDPSLVRQRSGRYSNGALSMVEYVEWHTVADILDKHAPNWSHTIKEIQPLGSIVTVTVAITIDNVTREGIGTGLVMSEVGIKKAEHDALKRAALKFGIARDLCRLEYDSREISMVDEPKPFIDRVAKTLGDLISTKQLTIIRSIAREININVSHECSKMMFCHVNELSKPAASDFIEHLEQMRRSPTMSVRKVG